jgi:hypothetical protein
MHKHSAFLMEVTPWSREQGDFTTKPVIEAASSLHFSLDFYHMPASSIWQGVT